MKKLKKISVSNSLTKNELSELIGGVDVSNKNNILGCHCSYNNQSLVTNDNSVQGCTCNCTY